MAFAAKTLDARSLAQQRWLEENAWLLLVSPGGSPVRSPVTETFDSDGSELVFTGTLTDATDEGHDLKIATGVNAGLWFEFYGTGCQFLIKNSAALWYKVDEGTKTAIAIDNTWHYETLATGLAEDWHLVHLCGGDGLNSGFFAVEADAIKVTGLSPAIREPQGLFDLTGNTYRADYAGLRRDGLTMTNAADWNYTLVPYNGFSAASGLGGRLRLSLVPDGSGNPMVLSVYSGSASGSYYRIAVDGVEDGTLGSMNAGAAYGAHVDLPTWHELATITAGATRLIDLWAWENACNRHQFIRTLHVTNGTISGTAPATAGDILGVLGDSISEADYGGGINGSGWVHKLCMDEGYTPANFGLYGYWLRDLVTGLPGSPTLRLTDLDAVDPAKIIVHIGVNDRTGGRTSAQYQTDMTALLDWLIANTTAAIKVPLFYNTLAGGDLDIVNQSRATWMTALTNARAACTTPARVVVWDTSGVLSVAADWQADGLHPTAQGQQKIATNMAANI
jgi:lysophospholipase L1-like esterase